MVPGISAQSAWNEELSCSELLAKGAMLEEVKFNPNRVTMRSAEVIGYVMKLRRSGLRAN